MCAAFFFYFFFAALCGVISYKLRNFCKAEAEALQLANKKNRGALKWKCAAHMRSAAACHSPADPFPSTSLAVIGIKRWCSRVSCSSSCIIP